DAQGRVALRVRRQRRQLRRRRRADLVVPGQERRPRRLGDRAGPEARCVPQGEDRRDREGARVRALGGRRSPEVSTRATLAAGELASTLAPGELASPLAPGELGSTLVPRELASTVAAREL